MLLYILFPCERHRKCYYEVRAPSSFAIFWQLSSLYTNYVFVVYKLQSVVFCSSAEWPSIKCSATMAEYYRRGKL